MKMQGQVDNTYKIGIVSGMFTVKSGIIYNVYSLQSANHLHLSRNDMYTHHAQSYQKRATKEALCQPQTLQTKMHERYRTYSCLLDPLRFFSASVLLPSCFFKLLAVTIHLFPKQFWAPLTSLPAQFLGFFSVLLQPGKQGMTIGHCHFFK